MKKKILNIIKIIIFVSIGIILIYLSVRMLGEDDKKSIITSFKNANLWWVILCFIFGFLSHFARASRWRRLFRPMGYNPKMDTMMYSVFVGYLANYAFPRLGDVTRCGMLTTYEKVPISKSLGTMLVERSLDLVMFILLFLLTIALEFNEVNSYIHDTIYPRMGEKIAFIQQTDHFFLLALLSIVVLLSIVYVVFRKKIVQTKIYKKIIEMIKGIWQGFMSLLKIKKPLIFILETLIMWVMYFSMSYICFFCIPETSHLGLNVGLSVLTIGSLAIMVTAGGTGLYPIIVGQIILIYGVEYAQGFALGWIIWTAQTLLILIFGGLSLLMLSFKKRKKEIHTT